MAKLVSKTYGDALFELAIEENILDVLSEEVEGLAIIFKENEELVRFLNHPKIAKEEKIQVVENIFKDRASDKLTGFLTLVISKDRYNDLSAIFEYFIGRVKEYKHIGVVVATSAVELTGKQKKALEARLLQTTKYQSLEMQYLIEPALIGGMVIRIGDRVIDSSIRTKLNTMTRSLMKIQL